ncbi:MAG: 1-acyl-sn-glycerol-3-phosphate acyltransferase [Crocinitomicaceae bacterium]
MTFLYWILKQTAPRTGEVYFGDIILENEQAIPEGKPFIFVANHPSSLLDPIVCGGYINVPIHFLGRADLFKKKAIAKFLRSAHMWPIYRSIDGKDSIIKNEQVFNECYASLKEGNPILLYGEGFTDEQFIRRVKKIKKGAARIAVGAAAKYNFELDMKIVPVGINYTNPEKLGGDLLIKFNEPISIKDYETVYKENEVKTYIEITNELEKRIKEEIIHIEEIEDAESFEKMIQLEEDTMHYASREGAPALTKRWKKTKQLAEKVNSLAVDEKESLFEKVNAFWKEVNAEGFELYIIRALQDKSNSGVIDLLLLLIGFPIALLGLIINLPLFILLKTLPQKLTPRITFYAGMKVAFGTFLTPILLSLEYGMISLFIYIPYLYPVILIGGIISGIFTVKYLETYRRFKQKLNAKKRLRALNLEELKLKYQALIQLINE